MKLKLSIALVVSLVAQWAVAANVVFYVGPSGQSLYVRIKNPADAYVATALTEGTSGADGEYYASEATIAALTGMSSASTGNGCAFTVRVGTASMTAADPIVAYGYLPWSGSIEVTSVFAALNAAIPGTVTANSVLDHLVAILTDTGEIGNTLDAGVTVAPNGLTAASVATDAATEIGAAAGSAATVSPFLVSKGHTWKFDTPSQVTSPNVLTEITGFDDLLVEMDFSGALSSSASIQTINSVAIADVGGATEPTVVSSAKRADQKGVNITLDGASATAATYTVSVNVTTTDGQTLVRKGRLTVQ